MLSRQDNPQAPVKGTRSGEITVAQALELPVLRRGLSEVVAGAASLDRPIRWVHAGEVPDIASLLRGGELLLSTGMGITSASGQQRFVAELASRGVAGLVIELGGAFVGSLPAGLVSAADQHGLPLIELHATVQFVAVTEAIHTEIVNRDYELLRRAEDLHRRFTQSMLSGEGVQGVLTLLADTLGNPVFLENHQGHLLAHAAPGDSSADDVVGAWAEAQEGAVAMGVAAAVPSGRAEGRLTALPLEQPFEPFTQLAIGRAADIIALALLRSRQEIELLALGRGDLLVKLAEGRIEPTVAANRAAEMGFADRKLDGLLPIAARLATPRHTGVPGNDQLNPTGGMSWVGSLSDLEREVGALGVPTLIGMHPVDGDLVILVGLHDRAEREAIADRASTVLHAAARRRAGAEIVVTVGAAGQWSEIGDGLCDAIETAAVAEGSPEAIWHDAKAMPLERLLWRLGEHDDVKRYVERVVGPLLEHDKERQNKLLPTLEALCAQGGRKAAAARDLNLNRQALYARIDRLEGILDVDLSDSDTLASIDFALRAKRQLRGTPVRAAACARSC